MESRWQKIGNYPLVSYTNGNGNVLNTQFFESSGQVFVSFTNPSKELLEMCNLYCEKELDKDSSSVTCMLLKQNNMGDAQYVQFVVDAVLAIHKFDDPTKADIKASINGFFGNNRAYKEKHDVIGLNEPIPMTPRLQEQFTQMAELQKPWYRRK